MRKNARCCTAKGHRRLDGSALPDSGVLIALHQSVNDNAERDATRRRLDQLIREAVGLRQQITAALIRDGGPFFPERRRAQEPYTPERRHPLNR